MRYFKVHELSNDGSGITKIVSEQQILDEFYDRWKEEMKLIGKEHLINQETCIDDWVTVNWASEVKGE